MANQVSQHINQLVDDINDVKATLDIKKYGMDPKIHLVIIEPVPSIKVKI